LRKKVSGFAERFRMHRQEDTKMKTITLALALASALFTFAPHTSAHAAAGADRRGTVDVVGRTVRAVTTGPALLHGYSGFSGGTIFVVPAVAGTDADCAAALANSGGIRPVPLAADRVAHVTVGAGQLACLVTDTRRPFELLWHTFPLTSSDTLLASAKR
jgi:hypothetical protein